VQELGDKKDRLEKWITNVLNGEDYSNQISSSKKILKLFYPTTKHSYRAFTAIIQTLKADPQMVNLIIYPV
jgi:hypothetical protein